LRETATGILVNPRPACRLTATTYGESLPIGPGWHVVPVWERRLRELAAAALLHAGELAAG